MKRQTYTQCVLAKGVSITTSFIPSNFAQIGRILRLKDSDGTWTDGWVVESCGAVSSEEDVFLYERIHLQQRKVSDI